VDVDYLIRLESIHPGKAKRSVECIIAIAFQLINIWNLAYKKCFVSNCISSLKWTFFQQAFSRFLFFLKNCQKLSLFYSNRIFSEKKVSNHYFSICLVGTQQAKKSHFRCSSQGCQIFLGTKYQNWKNIPNYRKIYQMSIKYTKRP
jgi:hypothetical protein